MPLSRTSPLTKLRGRSLSAVSRLSVLRGASATSLLLLASCAAHADSAICGLATSANAGMVVQVKGILQPGGEAGVKSLIDPECPGSVLYFEASRKQERELFDAMMDAYTKQKNGLGAYYVTVVLKGKVDKIDATAFFRMRKATVKKYDIRK